MALRGVHSILIACAFDPRVHGFRGNNTQPKKTKQTHTGVSIGQQLYDACDGTVLPEVMRDHVADKIAKAGDPIVASDKAHGLCKSALAHTPLGS